jgi:hypothetical protein
MSQSREKFSTAWTRIRAGERPTSEWQPNLLFFALLERLFRPILGRFWELSQDRLQRIEKLLSFLLHRKVNSVNRRAMHRTAGSMDGFAY